MAIPSRWRTPMAMPASVAIFAVLAITMLVLQPKVRQRLVALWHLRVAPASAMTPHLATIQYNEMLRILERQGIRKGQAQTPWEFATSLKEANLAAPVQELTAMYHAARFGGEAPDLRNASSVITRIQSFLRSQ